MLHERKDMFNHQKVIKFILISTIFMATATFAETKGKQEKHLSKAEVLTVYKRAQCGCCNGWMDHMKANDFHIIAHNHDNLGEIKNTLGISPKLSSCHTGVTKDGFIFEGHIPAKFIRKFLDEKPNGAKGLAVPAMPTGSPGMEYKDMFQPYKIYLLKKDGSIEVYAEVKTAEEQF